MKAISFEMGQFYFIYTGKKPQIVAKHQIPCLTVSLPYLHMYLTSVHHIVSAFNTIQIVYTGVQPFKANQALPKRHFS